MTMAPGAIELGSASGPATVLKPSQAPEQSTAIRENPQHEEYQYLDLIQDILDNGEHRPDRYSHSTVDFRTALT